MRRANTRKPPVKDDAKQSPDWLFYGYLLVFLIEYLGVANDLPVLKVLRFTTLLSYGLLIVAVARIGVGDLFQRPQTRIFISFVVFTTLSVLWAVVRSRAFDSIRPFVDYTCFFVLTALLVDRRNRFELFSWVCAFVSVVLVVRNFDKLGQETRVGGFAAGYFLGDGNDFSWGLVVMLPFILNLMLGKRMVLTKLIALAAFGICILGIIGTGSRGGTLGLAAAVLFYWLVMSRRKGLGALAVVLLVLGVIAFAPSGYLTRMQTISAYEEDSSAQARLETWGASMRMAIDYPLGVGAGNFPSAYGRFYVKAPTDSNISWANQRWLSAHSIYFRTLGEYGYLGAGLLLALLLINIKDNVAIRRACLSDPERAPFPVEWAGVVGMAMVGFSICGLFLGGLSYPHLFMLSGLTLVNRRLAEQAGILAPKGRVQAGSRRHAARRTQDGVPTIAASNPESAAPTSNRVRSPGRFS